MPHPLALCIQDMDATRGPGEEPPAAPFAALTGHRLLAVPLMLVLLGGCVFDRSGLPPEDAAHSGDRPPADVDAGVDGSAADLPRPDVHPDSSPPPSISGGFNHGCTLRQGELWCWGTNTAGQLGTGDTTGHEAPVRISSGWRLLSSGGQANHSCALQADGSPWCWGDNQYGQLGLGDSGGGTQRWSPTQVAASRWRLLSRGQRHTCGVDHGGGLWCWGYNDEGRLGLGDHSDRSAPTQVAAGETFSDVSAGDGHTCAVRSDGSLWCWGRNTHGQLGLGSQASVQYTLPEKVGSATWTQLTAGQLQTCGIQTDGSLWCWGQNSAYQLGLGDADQRDLPAQVGTSTSWLEVSTCWFHTCGVQTDGSLWCWGRNEEGQLGLGDNVGRSQPTELPGSDWLQAAASQFHTCAIQRNSKVWCTGENAGGQLGLGDTQRRELMTPLAFQ